MSIKIEFQNSIPFRLSKHNKIMVACKIRNSYFEDKIVEFILDTGANTSSICVTTQSILGFEINGKSQVRGVDNKTIGVDLISIPFMSIGNQIDITNISAFIGNYEYFDNAGGI